MAAGATALVVGGGIAAYFLINRQGQLNVMPTGATVIPQDAMMVVALTTDSQQWQQVREFGTTRSQATFDQYLAQQRDRALSGRAGLDYDRDIKPWIGKEVAIAVLPPQAGITVPPPGQPAIPVNTTPTVLVAQIADPLKAKEVLENSPIIKTGKWSERDYKGIKVREDLSNPNQSLSIAVLDSTQLVMTNTPKAMERAIDAFKENTAIARTQGFGEALGQINSDRPFARLYLNVSSSVSNVAGNSNRPVEPQELTQLQQMQGVAATAELKPGGVQFKSVLWLKPEAKQRFEVQNNAKLMASRLPNDTLMMAAGGNLKKFWQDLKQLEPVLPVRFGPAAIEQGIQTTFGLNFEKDLLDWMQGDFSFSMVPTQQKATGVVPLTYVFMTRATDRRAADVALKRFDEVMSKQYTFKLEETKVAGQPVVNLTSSNVKVSRGWLDGDVAFLSLSVGTNEAPNFVPKPPSALAEDAQFRRSTDSELKQNNGQFFTNLDRLLAVKDFPLVQLLQPLRTGMESMESIGVTSAVTNDRMSRYDVFVGLKKGQRPGPLPPAK